MITKEDIDKALKSQKLLEFFRDWNEMSKDVKEKWINRVVLYGTIQSGSFTDNNLQEIISKYDLAIDSNELDKSLVRLRLGYIIKKEEDNDSYTYRVPLFVKNILKSDVQGRFLREVEKG